jgi:hypothetical protein
MDDINYGFDKYYKYTNEFLKTCYDIIIHKDNEIKKLNEEQQGKR